MERGRRKPTVSERNGSCSDRDGIDSHFPETSSSRLSDPDNSTDTQDHLPNDLADWLNRENDKTSGASLE